jgi:hypothetical protein
MKEANDLQLQIASKNALSAIDCQGKTFNTNIAKIQAKNVFFWPLDDIRLVDWISENKFARFWYFEDIHHSSFLKLAIEKAFQKSTNAFKMIQTMKQNSLLVLCLHTKRHTVDTK